MHMTYLCSLARY